ncbi:MAG TPA: hypothetical protein VNA57_08330 [Acidimicrobiales bacterium]|nr:hypothetical protein [Acidimicrobiales bacterium]
MVAHERQGTGAIVTRHRPSGVHHLMYAPAIRPVARRHRWAEDGTDDVIGSLYVLYSPDAFTALTEDLQWSMAR